MPAVQPESTLTPCGAMIVALGSMWASPSAHAACPATPDQLAATARRASLAFAAMNPQDFSAAQQTLSEEVGCLTAIPTPSQAAAVHEVEALASFQVKNIPATMASLQAMHEADPTWSLIPEVAPPGGILDRLDGEARARSPSNRQLHPLEPGWSLIVDGSSTANPPISRPAVVVILNPNQIAVWSGLARAGDLPNGIGTPTVPSVTLSSAEFTRAPLTSTKGRGPAVPLFVAAGGTALVSGGLWLAFTPGLQKVRTIEQILDEDRTDPDWESYGLDPMTVDEVSTLYDRTRKLEIAAQVTTGVAVGLGTVGVVFAW